MGAASAFHDLGMAALNAILGLGQFASQGVPGVSILQKLGIAPNPQDFRGSYDTKAFGYTVEFLLPVAGLARLSAFGNAARAAATEGEAAGLAGVGGRVPNAGGFIRQFTQEGDQIYYRVYSDRVTGSFLTAIPPRSSAFAREALSLPPGNLATFIQEVVVPNGTPLLSSRALPAFGRQGGAEQFELLNKIPKQNFRPGVPLP